MSAAPVKVLMIWPGTEGPAAGNFGVPQLVVMATYLRKHTGAKIDIIDLEVERMLGGIDLPKLLAGPEGRGYDVIAFSCYASYDYLKCYAIAEMARAIYPNALLCAGGYHVSARPTDIVFDGSVLDVAVVGEGERPMVQIVESVAGGQPLRQKILGSDPITDLEQLPPTDWSYLDRYRSVARKVASQTQLYLSRGCPFDCAFCMERAKREVSWRSLSVERAVDEVKRLDSFLGLSQWTVYIADALFGMRKRWRREFLEALAREKIDVQKLWLLIRVDMVEDEDLRLFGEANCGLGFGLESGDPTMLGIIRKAGRLDDYLDRMKDISERARALNVPWGANIIVGHPGETEGSMRRSAQYMRELFLHGRGVTGFLSVDPFRLYPGSPIDDQRGEYESKYGTRFYRPKWWHDGDQEFLSEWVDPSGELTYRDRVALTGELYGPILAELPQHFCYRGKASDYFGRALTEQIAFMGDSVSLHYADRYYAWNRYVGRGDAARDEMKRDVELLPLLARLRAPFIESALRTAGFDATHENSSDEPMPEQVALAKAIAEVMNRTPRERFVPLECVAESVRDEAIGLDASGLATVSAMHAYLLTFVYADIQPGQRVLDLGAGTGYGTSLLSQLVGPGGHVVAVEIDPTLAALARENLCDADNVEVLAADALSDDLALPTPVDVITVGFAYSAPPTAAARWLREGGVIVAPVALGQGQRMWRARRRGGELVDETWLDAVVYVRARRSEEIATKPATAMKAAAHRLPVWSAD